MKGRERERSCVCVCAVRVCVCISLTCSLYLFLSVCLSLPQGTSGQRVWRGWTSHNSLSHVRPLAVTSVTMGRYSRRGRRGHTEAAANQISHDHNEWDGVAAAHTKTIALMHSTKPDKYACAHTSTRLCLILCNTVCHGGLVSRAGKEGGATLGV